MAWHSYSSYSINPLRIMCWLPCCCFGWCVVQWIVLHKFLRRLFKWPHNLRHEILSIKLMSCTNRKCVSFKYEPEWDASLTFVVTLSSASHFGIAAAPHKWFRKTKGKFIGKHSPLTAQNCIHSLPLWENKWKEKVQKLLFCTKVFHIQRELKP